MLRKLRPLFWNQEGRLRAGYRVIVFFLLWGYGPALVHGVVDRILSLVMAPGGQWSFGIWLDPVRLAVVVGAGWLTAHYIDRRPFSDYGFQFNRDWWLDLVFGMVLGAALMTAIFLVEWAAGWVAVDSVFYSNESSVPFGQALMAPMVLFIVVAVAEELLTRGNHIVNFAEGLHSWGHLPAVFAAWLLSSVIFGLLHIYNPHTTWVSTANLVLTGFFFGLGFVLTGQLALPIGLHFSWNLVQGNVFGFPVSGKVFYATSLVRLEQRGPELWTGGPFGPEAGLLGILAIMVGMLFTAGWVRWRYGDLSVGRVRLSHCENRLQGR